MLFNSYLFIFLFFPVALAGFLIFRRGARPSRALTWLILASIVFYMWWNPINLAIIAPSVLANYALARALLKFADDRPALGKALLVLGILGNVAFLSYFKYRNFLMEISNDALGTNFAFAHVILPLGISFITFQKIAFLVDVYMGRVTAFQFEDYCLFVFFFPQLIAGPIVHYREMMPQFASVSKRSVPQDLAVGGGIFFCGLFKKVILADGIAQYVSPVFAGAAAGEPVTLVYAWIATVGFTLQVYFDFSGYSEMALGAARCFGIHLPVNFNSPLRATSIIEFWKRWHVTLVRFLTAYVFNPLAFAIASRRVSNGLQGVSGPQDTAGGFLMILIVPTLVTMIASGVWHGAGYGFVIWGLLHGGYLVINHAWKTFRPRFWPMSLDHDRVMKPVGFVLTFVAVVVAMAFFRAPTLASGWNVFAGMWGFNGMSVPHAVGDALGSWLPAGVVREFKSGAAFAQALTWMAALLAVVWFLPNVLEIFGRYKPALGFDGMSGRHGQANFCVLDPCGPWQPSLRWSAAIAATAAVGILALGQPAAFLYWQF